MEKLITSEKQVRKRKEGFTPEGPMERKDMVLDCSTSAGKGIGVSSTSERGERS